MFFCKCVCASQNMCMCVCVSCSSAHYRVRKKCTVKGFFFSSISLLRDAQGFQRCDDFNTRVGVPLHIAMFFLSVRHQPMNYKLLRCSSKDAAAPPPVSLHFLPRPRKSPPPPPFVFGATLIELCVVCGGGFTTVRPISLHGSRKRTPATTTTASTLATKPQRNKETNEGGGGGL